MFNTHAITSIYTQVVIAWFVAKFPAAILIKSYSNISDNGSDDAMAKVKTTPMQI